MAPENPVHIREFYNNSTNNLDNLPSNVQSNVLDKVNPTPTLSFSIEDVVLKSKRKIFNMMRNIIKWMKKIKLQLNKLRNNTETRRTNFLNMKKM